MLRRLVALAAMLLFIAMPVAAAVCEASCAQHTAMATTGGRHACCPEGPTGNGATLRGVITLCDHPTDAPESTTTQSHIATVAPPPATARALPIWFVCARTRAGRVLSTPPDPFALSTHLRI